ncbi:MAG: alkaline phosphatase family protein [Isosphaeraceae bacterium]
MAGAKSDRVTRVIVVGLDGLEPKIVDAMLQAGELPNLARLAASGGYSRVATTSPAQTPVAWSSFATGTNPGGHGVFDFIRRDPATYLPDLGLNRYEQKSAWLPPKAVNLRRGTPVWDVLAAAGVGSTILRCPCTYPAALGRGRMLSGMGVPDLRGGQGTPTFFTSDPSVQAGESEAVVHLASTGPGPIATRLPGPRNPKDRSLLHVDLTLTPDVAAGKVTVRAGEGPGVEVPLGGWSDWLAVRFKAGMLQNIRGLVRFHLVRLEPAVELYASPVNFDPEQPPFPISAPGGYAQELAQAIGPYYTTGMVEDHTGLNNERIDEHAFLDQCAEVWDERESMMLHELGRFESGLFYCLFDTPDRVQHMFWRFREPGHPANLGRPVREEFAREVENQYKRADEVVGQALQACDDRTLLVVLSDHGFGPFRRGFHVNTWLHDQGLLALRDGLKPGRDALRYPDCIDWSRTKAFALGLAGIYLNVEGREAKGIVRPADAERLKAEIARGLHGLVDPERGAVAVRRALPREEVYQGPFAAESPDLVLHTGEGYRISWEAAMGGVPEGHFEDNRKKWSGDHIVDPALVPGVLFMNRGFQGEGARLVDLAPTILDALGVAANSAMEGRTLR